MESKIETAAPISREELKAIAQEAVRTALLDMKSELKPLVKELLRELLNEPSSATLVKNNLSQAQFDMLLNETSEQYRKVWKALA